jgi:hypothetical protein
MVSDPQSTPKPVDPQSVAAMQCFTDPGLVIFGVFSPGFVVPIKRRVDIRG